MDIQKLTKEQAVIISGFTGILCGEFSDFHADVEKRLGRGVQTFEFGFKEFATEVKKLYEADFIEMGTVDKEQAKAQAVPEWISVENELPKRNIKVLLNIVARRRGKPFSCIGFYSVEPDDEPCFILDDNFTILKGVTHWMQLPQAPKAQEPAND